MIMSSSSSSVPQSQNVSALLAELLTASTDATRVWLRAEMDRTVNPILHSIFNRLNNKLVGNTNFDQSVDDGGSAQVNQLDHVKSPNLHLHHSATFNDQPSTPISIISNNFNAHLYQAHSIGYEPEFDPEKLTQVKREIKEEENEMTLQNLMDNTQQIEGCDEYEEDMSGQVGHIALSHQVNTSPTDAHHLLHNSNCDEQFVNQPIDDDHQPNGQVNNATDNDTFDGSLRDETTNDELISSNQTHNADGSNASSSSNELSKHNLTNSEDEEEDQVNHDTQQLGSETNSAQIVHIEEEEGEKESRTLEDVRIETAQPHRNGQTLEIVRQSARYFKRKQNDEENNQKDTEEDDKVDGESSRPVKRTRMDTTQPNNARKRKEIATEPTTNPIQPNLVQPNRHLQCSHCLKSFAFKSKLQRHLRVHTGERPFQCNQCDKRFSQADTLTQHQLIHQNIKRFRCPKCAKQFTQKPHLDSHFLTHSGVRPFKCRHCEKSFTQSNIRNYHEQAIHLHVKPYRCKQCGHTATTRSDVIRHIRAVHFGLPRIIKQQRALNIVDDRDPRELLEKV